MRINSVNLQGLRKILIRQCDLFDHYFIDKRNLLWDSLVIDYATKLISKTKELYLIQICKWRIEIFLNKIRKKSIEI